MSIRMGLAVQVASMVERRDDYRALVGQPEGKGPVVRPRHRYDNVSPSTGMWFYGLDLDGTGQGELAGTCECGNEPSGCIKCRKIS